MAEHLVDCWACWTETMKEPRLDDERARWKARQWDATRAAHSDKPKAEQKESWKAMTLAGRLACWMAMRLDLTMAVQRDGPWAALWGQRKAKRWASHLAHTLDWT